MAQDNHLRWRWLIFAAFVWFVAGWVLATTCYFLCWLAIRVSEQQDLWQQGLEWA